MKFKVFTGLILAVMFMLTSCSEDSNVSGSEQFGRLTVKLTDAPFPYELVAEANVTIFKVEARLADQEEEEDNGMEDENEGSPFITLMEEEIDVNLLNLVNGTTMDLADLEVPAGTYDLVRVYVKGVNVVLTDERVFDLKVPSGAQTGIKVFIDPPLTVTGGLSSDLLLDFDVSRSFVAKGNINTPAGINGFNFKPVIKASNMSTAGTLSGMVLTIEEEMEVGLEGAQISVFAADTLNTTAFTDPAGQYAIMGLTAGSYEVFAELEGYIASDTVNVQIDAANITTQDFILEIETP